MRAKTGLLVLRERNFALLYGARTVSLIGDGMTPVALAFAVLGLTGSTADLGIVLAARSLMVVTCILAGGVWADRLSPRVAMLIARGGRRDLPRALGEGGAAGAHPVRGPRGAERAEPAGDRRCRDRPGTQSSAGARRLSYADPESF